MGRRGRMVSFRARWLATEPVACIGFRLWFYNERRCRVASTNNEEMPKEFGAYLSQLIEGYVIPLDSPDHPPWFEAGSICEVSEKTFRVYFEMATPHWMMFAFSEDRNPLRLFWQSKGCYFGRELTEYETQVFCDLAQIAGPQ